MNFPPLSDLGVTDFEIAPPANLHTTLVQRHPLSNPHETARKSEVQCQQCFKSKVEGITLFKYSGCKFEEYCVSFSLRALGSFPIFAKSTSLRVELSQAVEFSTGAVPRSASVQLTIAVL